MRWRVNGEEVQGRADVVLVRILDSFENPVGSFVKYFLNFISAEKRDGIAAINSIEM